MPDTRIALFLPDLEIGGVERAMLNLASGFQASGLEVDLVLTRASGGYLTRVPPGVRLIDLQARRVSRSLVPLIRYLRAEHPYGLITAKDYASIVAVVAKEIARVSTRVVVAIHTTLSAHITYSTKFKERKIVPLLAKLLYPRAYRLVAVSESVASDAAYTLGIPLDKIEIVYNPVVGEELMRAANEPIDHPWFQPGASPVVLSIGRLTRAKDFPTLVMAFAQVREKREARLAILGDGEERPKIEELIRLLGLQNDVWLPGFVDRPYPYLARASVFAMSSLWEGLPTALIEALALGIPVVATDCPGGSREILDNGRFGELVPVGDAKSLADAILRALSTPRDPQMLRKRAQEFSVDNAVSKYLALLGLEGSSGRKSRTGECTGR